MIRVARSVAAAAALFQAGSAAVLQLPIWFRNSYALIDVSIGTPAESHLLMFDTGSSTTWVVDRNCANGACANYSGYNRTGYDISASSTGSSLGVYDSIDYLGGVTGGPAVRDVFRIGHTYWNQTFIAADTSSWSVMPSDGFFGLAFSSIAEPSTLTVVETLMQDGLLDEHRFGLYYGTEFNDTHGAPGKGVLTLGASEEAKYVDGPITWLTAQKDLNGTVYELWRSTLRKISGSRKVAPGHGSSFNGSVAWAAGQANGVFDTGAGGGITIPSSQIDAVYESIGWNFPSILNGSRIPLCSDFNASWSVTLSFSDDGVQYHDLTLRGDQLARPGFANRDDACWPPFDPGYDSDSLILIGQPILRLFYTIFDFGSTRVADYKPRIGFGKLRQEYCPPVGH